MLSILWESSMQQVGYQLIEYDCLVRYQPARTDLITAHYARTQRIEPIRDLAPKSFKDSLACVVVVAASAAAGSAGGTGCERERAA